MRQLRGGLRLALEAPVKLVGAGEDRVQHLDRDEPLGLDVLALIHGADAALAEPRLDAIAAVDGRAEERVERILCAAPCRRRRPVSPASAAAFPRRCRAKTAVTATGTGSGFTVVPSFGQKRA